VHLCAWPAADDEAADAGVSFDMAAARHVVEMGRAARNAAAVKTRQPLAEVVIAVPAAEREAVERLREVVLDELNVKDLRFVDDGGALVAYVVKPNLPVLGPRLGKQLGAVRAALAAADAAALVAALRADGAATLTLADGSELRLAGEDLLVETGSPEGYQVESDGGRVVALKTALDDALREEGLVRELVHAVQLARKNAGLRIEDTIDLVLELPAGLGAVLDGHEATVKGETLASGLTRGPVAGAHTETAKVEGLEIGIGLTATGTIFTTPYG
jgi:isoleucyl-tRNA synthetase